MAVPRDIDDRIDDHLADPTAHAAAIAAEAAAAYAAAAADLAAKKLDDMAAPDDNTDLNASASAHGLMPKRDGDAGHFYCSDGTQKAPPAGGGISTLKKTADQIINGTAFQDIAGLTFPVSANTDYAFDFYITFRSAATTTGFRFSVNGPAGVVDFFMTYQTIANSETAGVATWLQKHSVTFNAMTVTTATIAAGVDLHCRITGRFKCGGAGGTFAARAASELANNDLVVQKGSWGTYF